MIFGRFHRPDPVRGNFRNPQRLNRYAYVTNNPVRYTDPRGLDMVDPANAEGFWGGMGGGDRNPYPVINYSSGEGFALGSLHYRTGDGGGTGYWYNDLQNSYMDWLNASPVGCWDGSGFRDPACVAAGGDSSGGVDPGMPLVTRRDSWVAFYDCVKGCLGTDLDFNTRRMLDKLKQVAVGGVVVGLGTCAAIVAAEPYLLPGYPLCAAFVTGSTWAVGGTAVLGVWNIGNMATTVGCVGFCAANEL